MHQFTALRLVHLIPDHAYLQPTQFWVTFNVTRSDVSVYIDFKHLITFYVASHIYSIVDQTWRRRELIGV